MVGIHNLSKVPAIGALNRTLSAPPGLANNDNFIGRTSSDINFNNARAGVSDTSNTDTAVGGTSA